MYAIRSYYALGLKDLVMARMAPLAPSLNSSIYRGQLLSADRRHLLVTARPLASGTDTASARRIAEFVITSYSIHYTKLYDGRTSRRRMQAGHFQRIVVGS